MDHAQGECEWAGEEFGSAELGDRRRVDRLVAIAATLANRPAGKVTEAFEEASAREGTFRLLENDAVVPEAIAEASHRACARRAASEAYAFVSVDGTSLNIIDRKRQKGLGLVGARKVGATGLQVMSALAVSRSGVPLGLCGQSYWARTKRTRRKDKKPIPVGQCETKYWLKVMRQVRSVFASEAPRTQPWFQLDRGADAWPVLLEGLNGGDLFTVRAGQDRRLTMSKGDEQRRYLWSTLEAQPLLSSYELTVPARPARRTHGRVIAPRRGRTAKMEVRACKLTLDLRSGRNREKKVPSSALWALLACETQESAGADDPIEWMLLTNRPVLSIEDAELVIYGYTQRWRIEEFHKCWKSGVCKVEETQLQARDHIERWATVLAAVAVRVLRLTYLARHQPGLSSLEELAPCEVEAIVLAAKSKDLPPGSIPPISVVVDVLARLGGYVGRSSGGPPGPIVISRGLFKIELLADLLLAGIVTPNQEERAVAK